MGGTFANVVAAGQDFAENTNFFGESFTYGGATLVGVFSQVEVEYEHSDFSIRRKLALVCVSSKTQWTTAGVSPGNRGTLTYNSIDYTIEGINGADTPGEPAFTLTLFRKA